MTDYILIYISGHIHIAYRTGIIQFQFPLNIIPILFNIIGKIVLRILATVGNIQRFGAVSAAGAVQNGR